MEALTPTLEPLLSDLKRARESIPLAHQLRQAMSEIFGIEAELKQLRPGRAKAEKNLETAKQQIKLSEKKIEEISSRINASAFNSTVRDDLIAKIHKCEQLDAAEKRLRELEESQKKKLHQVAELNPRLAKAETSLQVASKKREMFAGQLRVAKKQRDETLRKHGSPDAIKAVIETNRRRLNDERKRARLERDAEALREDQAARIQKLDEIKSELNRAQVDLFKSKLNLEELVQKHSAEELKQSIKEGKPCPVCEQLVKRLPRSKKHPSIEHAKRSVLKFEQEAHRLITTKSTIQGGLSELTPQLESKKREIEECVEAIKEAIAKVRFVLKKTPGPNAEGELEHLRQHVLELNTSFEKTTERVEEAREAESIAKEALDKVKRQLVDIESQISAFSEEQNRLKTDARALKASLGKYTVIALLRVDLKEQDDAKRDLDAEIRLKEIETKRQSEAKDSVTEASLVVEGLKVKGEGLQRAQTKLDDTIRRLSKSLAKAFPNLKIDAVGAERDAAAQLERLALKLQTECEGTQKRVLQREEEIKTLKVQIARASAMRAEMEMHRGEAAVTHELAQALRGDQFIAFIQQEAYNRLAMDGSTHLKMLSTERYSFGFEKEDFVVLDHWNADESRPVTTLSGGESFLASLSLALALAEGLSGLSHGRGGFILESLFLDEGFGTLDAETLDIVLQGIEGLSTGDRLVGIISHIPELADRMPSQIYVRKAVGGSSIEMN